MLRVLTLSTLFPDARRPQFGIFVERQAAALQAREGVALEVVAPIGLPPWPLSRHPHYRRFADIPQRESWNGMIVHRPRFRVWPKIGAGLAPRAMAHRLVPVLQTIRERFPFDVIDAQFFYPDGPAAMRLARRLGVPFSIKARGSDIHYWGARIDTRGAVRAAGRHAGGLLAVSEALKADMVALGMPGDRIAIHRTGIDKTLFRPGRRDAARRALGLSAPLLVCIGALIARKRQQAAIEAMSRIPDAQLALIGDGPDRERLATLIARLGLEDRVALLGSLPHEAIADYLAAADALIHPSENEGLANVWVEALASGTPIVIADAGGARELVDRPAAGAIVDRNPQAIADAIRRILAAPPDPHQVAETVAGYSWEANAALLEAHLETLARPAG